MLKLTVRFLEDTRMYDEKRIEVVTSEDKQSLLGNIGDCVSSSPDCAAFCGCACSCGFCISQSEIEAVLPD